MQNSGTKTAPAQRVTKEELGEKLLDMGGEIVKLTVKAGLLYPTLTAAGLILGAVGAGLAAGHFALGAFAVTGLSVLGAAAGAVAGFFGAKIAVVSMIEDMLLKRGLQAGEMGLRELRRLFKAAKEKAPFAKKQLAALENLTGAAHEGVASLGENFDAAKQIISVAKKLPSEAKKAVKEFGSGIY